jgi:hypothetical protein
MNDMYLTRKEQEETQIREEMQKELALMKLYRSNNNRCVALTQKYERQGIKQDLLGKFRSLYQ